MGKSPKNIRSRVDITAAGSANSVIFVGELEPHAENAKNVSNLTITTRDIL
jgi:hypothetical protein